MVPPNPPSGASPPPYLPPQQHPATLGDEKATSSLVFAILGLLLCPLLAIVAFVQSNPLKQQSKRTGQPLNSLVNAAWIISIIGLCLMAVSLLFILLSIAIGFGGLALFSG